MNRRSRSRHLPPASDLDELFVRADAAWTAGRHREARDLFRAAATQGHEGSQVNLGYFAERGIGMRRDIAEALRWYRRASRNGSSSADNNIGIIHAERGNVRLAIKWLKRAISKGAVDSGVMLGKIYAERGDTPTAMSYWREVVAAANKVAESDLEEAQALLDAAGRFDPVIDAANDPSPTAEGRRLSKARA